MDKLLSAHKRFLQDFKPDYCTSPALASSGRILEILDYKQYRWPGHGVSKESGYQALEGEYMRAEDYQALIDDPTDFWIRTLMPRIFGALESLKDLSPFPYQWELITVAGQIVPFGIR
jgi:hypothetical protein